MKQWPLQDAKARFSELVKLCTKEGPQGISVRGKEEAIILSVADYKKLVQPQQSLVDFLTHSPLKGVALEIARDKTKGREIPL